MVLPPPPPRRQQQQQRRRGSRGGIHITPNVPPQRSTHTSSGSNIPSTNQSRHTVVTPAAAITSSSTGRSMTVDKQIVDELLLVCGVIGTTTKVPSNTNTTTSSSNSNRNDNDDQREDSFTIVPVTDCVQWLQDLQRCLRRDDDVTRPISILLHSWNIVVQKLLPLVYHTQYDTTLIITICKIIVLLTKPLHTQTILAGRMMIHTKPSSANHITEA
jgi:Timeless protein